MIGIPARDRAHDRVTALSLELAGTETKRVGEIYCFFSTWNKLL